MIKHDPDPDLSDLEISFHSTKMSIKQYIEREGLTIITCLPTGNTAVIPGTVAVSAVLSWHCIEQWFSLWRK